MLVWMIVIGKDVYNDLGGDLRKIAVKQIRECMTQKICNEIL